MTGAARPSNGGAAVGKRRIPANHTTNAVPVAIRPRYPKPTRFRAVGTGGRPSTTAERGTSSTALSSSCQPVAAIRFGGAGKRFVSTTPTPNDTLAATAASTPTASMSAPARPRTTISPTPSIATMPRTRLGARPGGGRPAPSTGRRRTAAAGRRRRRRRRRATGTRRREQREEDPEVAQSEHAGRPHSRRAVGTPRHEPTATRSARRARPASPRRATGGPGAAAR